MNPWFRTLVQLIKAQICPFKFHVVWTVDNCSCSQSGCCWLTPRRNSKTSFSRVAQVVASFRLKSTKQIECLVSAPDFDKSCWTDQKFSLGFDFPNLPYFIDGDIKLTQVTLVLIFQCHLHLDRPNCCCNHIPPICG